MAMMTVFCLVKWPKDGQIKIEMIASFSIFIAAYYVLYILQHIKTSLCSVCRQNTSVTQKQTNWFWSQNDTDKNTHWEIDRATWPDTILTTYGSCLSYASANQFAITFWFFHHHVLPQNVLNWDEMLYI